MPRFIDIGTPQKPFFMDVENLTCLYLSQDKKSLTLYNATGPIAQIGEDWGVDASLAADKLLALLSFIPFGSLFVAPAAVAYVTLSKPSPGGLCGITAGIKGFGTHSCSAMPLDMAEKFIEAIHASGKQFIAMDPDEAFANWTSARKLYIDPQAVTRLRTDCIQINASFENADTLGIRAKEYDTNDGANFLRREDPSFKLTMESMNRAHERATQENHKLRRALADKIAAANPRLARLSDSTHAVYVLPENIVFMSLGENNSLCAVMTENRKETMERQIHLDFASAADRQDVIDRLGGRQGPSLLKLRVSRGPRI